VNIIEPYVEVDKFNPDGILRALEFRGRRCYKSEDKITADSAEKFVRGTITRGHESVIEHEKISVNFVIDRGVSHELVRHRLASFSQESTRYCNYGKQDEITVIRPFWVDMENGLAMIKQTPSEKWYLICRNAELAYLQLLKAGWSPQQARSVLPNSLKTEVETTFNLREWRHFFKVRAQAAAHPQMQQVAIPLLREFQKLLPAIFDDINYNLLFPKEHFADIRFRDVTA